MIFIKHGYDACHIYKDRITFLLGEGKWKMFGKLTDNEIEELVRDQLVGRIGCHADGITYVVPVSYVYDGAYIYGNTYEGMKIDMMRKNPEVCFEIEDTRDMANWKSVIAWGEFQELSGKEKDEALQKLNARVLPFLSSETMRISPLWPFSDEDNENVKGIIFRIRLTKKTGRFEKSSDSYFYAT